MAIDGLITRRVSHYSLILKAAGFENSYVNSLGTIFINGKSLKRGIDMVSIYDVNAEALISLVKEELENGI